MRFSQETIIAKAAVVLTASTGFSSAKPAADTSHRTYYFRNKFPQKQ